VPDDRPIPTVSVIIAAYQAAMTLGEQLDALAAQCCDEPFEIIVADNRSTDGTAELVRQRQRCIPQLRLIDASGRQGAPYARNLAGWHARGRLLLFTDADDVVAPGWIAALTAALRDSEVVAGALDHDALNLGSNERFMPRIFTDRLPVPYGFLPYAPGNNLGVTAEAFREVGGYAEGSPAGWDIDIAWRLQLSGRPLRFVPEARVAYRYRTNERDHLRQMITYGAAEPWLYRRFRLYGMRRRSAREVLGSARYLVQLLVAPRTPANRAALNRLVGYSVGRLQGSVRHRVLYP
jgi:glycosyltransferase involved in cell wall biosynthesis